MLREVSDKIIDSGPIDEQHALPEDIGKLLDEFFLYLDSKSIHATTGPLPTGVDENRQNRLLSMQHAASCLLDYERTTVFARGLYFAIQELKRRFPGDKLEIMYAGTGPFATLVMCIISKLDPKEVNFTMLEENEASWGIVKRVVDRIGLDTHFDIFNRDQFINADAVRFQPPKRYHLILTETMHSALTHEPQAAITANLGRYLLPNGIFLPESVDLSIDGMDPESGLYRQLNRIVEVRSDFSLSDLDVDKTVGIPSEINRFRLATKVQVFEGNILLPDRSRITQSIYFNREGSKANALHVQHRLGAERAALRIEFLTDVDVQ